MPRSIAGCSRFLVLTLTVGGLSVNAKGHCKSQVVPRERDDFGGQLQQPKIFCWLICG
jgi:hypothetical protein